jgi:hypothetical protein
MSDIINGVASEYEMPKPPVYYYETAERTSVPIKTSTIMPQVKQIKVVEYTHDFKRSFESEVNELLQSGYGILSTKSKIHSNNDNKIEQVFY